MESQRHLFSVGELTDRIKFLLEGDRALQQLEVKGEISDFKLYPSGHAYFTLKDERAVLKAVFFGARPRLDFTPEPGMGVIASGRISVYEKRGAYQLYVTRLRQVERGKLWEEFERLKRKLAAEGLFEPSRKRPLPQWIHKVVLVASPAGAAVKDVLQRARARGFDLELLFLPSRVQGEEAIADLVAAIERANRDCPDADCLVLARGGGSLEDLWAFNEEPVVRAIYASKLPVVSAVGHERDVTLADLAADVRVPPPTAAGELITRDRRELADHLASLRARLVSAFLQRARLARQSLADLGNRLDRALQRTLADHRQSLDALFDASQRALLLLLERRKSALSALSGRLEAVNPKAVLQRGYALCERTEDGRLVTSIAQVEPQDSLSIHLHDGRLLSRILEKEATSND